MTTERMGVDVLAAIDRALGRLFVYDAELNEELNEARAAVAELVAAVAAVYGEPCYDEDNAGDDPCTPDCMSCRIRAALAPFSEAGR